MVYMVYYKYISGWKTIYPEIFEEINNAPILGLYSNYHQALIEAIKWNIEHRWGCCEEYPELYDLSGNIMDFNNITVSELEKIYNELIKDLESDRSKYTEKYCIIKEYNIR